MFILTDEPMTWLTVRVPRLDETGNPSEQTCKVKVVLVDYDEFNALISTQQTSPEEERALIRRLARDWEGVVQPNKQAIPFTPENLDKVSRAPMFAGAFFAAYFRGWRGQNEEREGNSNASPAGGPAGGSPVPTMDAGSPETPTSSG